MKRKIEIISPHDFEQDNHYIRANRILGET